MSTISLRSRKDSKQAWMQAPVMDGVLKDMSVESLERWLTGMNEQAGFKKFAVIVEGATKEQIEPVKNPELIEAWMAEGEEYDSAIRLASVGARPEDADPDNC